MGIEKDRSRNTKSFQEPLLRKPLPTQPFKEDTESAAEVRKLAQAKVAEARKQPGDPILTNDGPTDLSEMYSLIDNYANKNTPKGK